MNVIGYTVSLFSIILLHILLKQFIFMQKEQTKLIEHYKNKLKFTDIDYDAIEREDYQKYIDHHNYDYKKVDFSKIEGSDGYDKNNDYDLLKKDLMKYINGANNYLNPTKHPSPIKNEQGNILLNPNVSTQPLIKKENKFKGIDPGVSLDKQYKIQFEQNNKNKNLKTLKPDIWTYKNEKPMNGGLIDSSGLMPYDENEGSNYVLI